MIPINEARVGLVSLRHWWCSAQWRRVFSRKNWPRDQRSDQETDKRPSHQETNILAWGKHPRTSRLLQGEKSNFFVKDKSQKAEHVWLSHTSAILDQYWGQRSQMGSYVMCHYRYTHVLWIHIRGRMNDDRDGLLRNKKVPLTWFLAEGHLQKSELDFGRT